MNLKTVVSRKCGWKNGVGLSLRFIPIHSLYRKLGKSVINSLLKLHILTGCNATSKVGTKPAAIKVSQEVNLWKFCSFESKEYGFKDAELFVIANNKKVI